MTTGQYTVVPFTSKGGWLEIHFCQLFLGYLHSSWVVPGVKLCFDAKPCGRGRTSNQIDNGLIAYQRSASPVLRDEGKHTMLNFIPLARPWREVTNMDT